MPPPIQLDPADSAVLDQLARDINRSNPYVPGSVILPVPYASISFQAGVPASPLTVGNWARVRVPFAMDLLRWDVGILGAPEGEVTLDVRYSPPWQILDDSEAASICGTDPTKVPQKLDTTALPQGPSWENGSDDLSTWTVTHFEAGGRLVLTVLDATVVGVVALDLTGRRY